MPASNGASPSCLSPGPQQKKHPGWCFFFALAPCRLPTGLLLPLPFAGAAAKKKTPWVVFFFLLRPRADAHSLTAGLGGDASPLAGAVFFFCCGPARTGVVFFFCCGPARTLTHSRWAGAISARPGWCFFFLLRPRRVFLDNSKKSRGRSKKKTPWVVFFFCSGPVPASNGASPSLAFRRGRSKKKNTLGGVFFFAAAPRGRSLTHCGPGWRCLPLAGAVFFFLLRPRPDRGGVFFLLWPRPDAHSLTVGWGDFGKARVVFFSLLRPRRVFLDNSKKSRGRSQKKTPWVVFFFLLWPRAGFQRGFSFPCLSPGPQQKKHPGWCFFFLLWPRAGFQRGFSFPCLSPGPQQKKKHPGWCFFFCCGPARTLTHSLRAWVAMPPPRRGGVFFFAAAPPGPGWCFFFCCGPARTLTHSRWAGAISARPGWCFFFCCGPAGSF